MLICALIFAILLLFTSSVCLLRIENFNDGFVQEVNYTTTADMFAIVGNQTEADWNSDSGAVATNHSILIPQITIEKALSLATEAIRKDIEKELHFAQNNSKVVVKRQVPASLWHFRILPPTLRALQIAHQSSILLQATGILMSRQGLTARDFPASVNSNNLQTILPRVGVSQVVNQIPSTICSPQIPCDLTARFRTSTGWCNNLHSPQQGNSHTQFRRLLAPQYQDGFNAPRQLSALSRRPLPSTRLVSWKVHSDVALPHPKYALLLVAWGQFTDHDLTLTPMTTAQNGNSLDCSSCDSSQTVSPNCFPIPIPSDDPFFVPFDNLGRPKCFAFVRSLQGQLTLGPRQQMDVLTSYLDASQIYGSDDCQTRELRAFTDGLLLFREMQSGMMLPANQNDSNCRTPQPLHCFKAGDIRVNEQLGLAMFHTIWLREHNRIARTLRTINPHWDDERTFQETRKIIGAMHQRITFGEWLPIVLGPQIIALFGLGLLSDGYYMGYDASCDVTVSNEFAAAAFRFGHSMLENFIKMGGGGDFGTQEPPLDLKNIFFEVSPVYTRGFLEKMMTGLTTQPAETRDRFIVSAVTQHLFEERGKPRTGLDLPALNMQRGRDHGLPPYIHYRRLFGLSVPRSFVELAVEMDNQTIAALQSVYESVEDIDLFPGLISERSMPGAVLGPTAARIIGDQFQRLRKCDRFWFENGGQAGSFTPQQLTEIRKMSLAKLVCSDSLQMRHIQPNLFLMPDSFLNRPIACQQFPDFDLSAWKELGSNVPIGNGVQQLGAGFGSVLRNQLPLALQLG